MVSNHRPVLFTHALCRFSCPATLRLRASPYASLVLRSAEVRTDYGGYAFDLLELNGTDLRRESIEVRKTTASILRRTQARIRVRVERAL
jgi:ATP-dependent DNA ligase